MRRCQAAGYQQEGGMEGVVPEPVAVLLTREAGPGATIDIRFIVPDPDNRQPPRSGPWTVHMGGNPFAGRRVRAGFASQVCAKFDGLAVQG
ncbi:MAG: hypothetical protein IPJ18_03350 [Betaproteobacteria bacterium]|nr:hypothetical protein [Betaproteobacteria bacterium]